MTGKSTSIHNLSADKGLNRFQKALYMLLNLANNMFPYAHLDNSLEIRDFTCKDLGKDWPRLDIEIFPSRRITTPTRKLSDLFWLRLPWDKIKEELNEIHVLDTGCGSGDYGRILEDFSDNKISSYTGIDIHKHDNWTKLEETYSNFRFHQFEGNDISGCIPEGTNFFMTQSAIEHFDEDLSFFEQIRDYMLSCQRSIIQIHLFTSRSCLRLYRFHGARQYTPRTVSKITRLFKDFSYAVLFNLGGKECKHLHYEYNTKPLLIQKMEALSDQKIKEYDRLLPGAIEEDMKHSQKSPIFYALIIHSKSREKIF